MMVDTWLVKQPAVTATQVWQLRNSLRLGQLTQAFHLDALDSFKWLQLAQLESLFTARF